ARRRARRTLSEALGGFAVTSAVRAAHRRRARGEGHARRSAAREAPKRTLLAIPLLVTLAHAQSVAATIATPGGSSLSAALPGRTPVAQTLAAQTLTLPFAAEARDVEPFSGQVAVAALSISENQIPGVHELSFRNGATVR